MRRLPAVLLGIGLAVLLLWAGSLVLRPYADDEPTAPVPEAESWTMASDELGWRLRPGFRGHAEDYERSFDDSGFRSEDSLDIVDSSRTTVLFLGASITFGYGVPNDGSFAKVLESARRDIRTVNFGVPGYSSYQGAVLLEREVDRIRPAVVVVSFNFNDRRFVVSAEDVDDARKMERIAAARRQWELALTVRRFPVFGTYLQALDRLSPDPDGQRAVALDSLQPRVDERAYERNLTHIAELAQRAGASVIFLLMHDNPLETAVLRDTTSTRGERLAALRAVAGAGLLHSILARRLLVSELRSEGNHPTADSLSTVSVYSTTTTDGAGPIRLDAEYHEIARRVAARTGSVIIDVGSLFAHDSKYYLDATHPGADGHRLIGEALTRPVDSLLRSSTASRKRASSAQTVRGPTRDRSG